MHKSIVLENTPNISLQYFKILGTSNLKILRDKYFLSNLTGPICSKYFVKYFYLPKIFQIFENIFRLIFQSHSIFKMLVCNISKLANLIE